MWPMPSSQLVWHSCHCSLHFQSKAAQGGEGNIISEITLGALSAAMRHASWESSMAVLRYLVAKSLCGGGEGGLSSGTRRCIDREYLEMTITCTVFVPPMIFVVDPPVVGSDKVPNLYSLKKNTLGFQTQNFQSCMFPQVGCWRYILSHRAFVWETSCSLCKSCLAQPAVGGGGLLLLFCYFPLAKYRFFWLFSCLTRKTVPSGHRVPADASWGHWAKKLQERPAHMMGSSWKSHETSTVYRILYQP